MGFGKLILYKTSGEDLTDSGGLEGNFTERDIAGEIDCMKFMQMQNTKQLTMKYRDGRDYCLVGNGP